MKAPKIYCFCVDGHGSISEGGEGEVRDDAKGEVGVEEGRLRERVGIGSMLISLTYTIFL